MRKFRTLGNPKLVLAAAVSLTVFNGLGAGLPVQDQRDASGQSTASPARREIQTKLLREGNAISNETAHCRMSGERLVIEIGEEGRTLTALENLAAQRILEMVIDDPTEQEWIVTGKITEFQERNFILVERASRSAAR